MHENLSQSCSANEDESKQIVVNKPLSQNNYADVDKLSDTEEDKSECIITKQKDTKNEFTYDVLTILTSLTYLNAEEYFGQT